MLPLIDLSSCYLRSLYNSCDMFMLKAYCIFFSRIKKNLPGLSNKFLWTVCVIHIPVPPGTFWCMLKCLRKTNRIDFNFLCQVIEIPRGSKVKYELDKKTGLIKVKQCCLPQSLIAKLYFLLVLIFPVFHFNVCACAGGPCPVFISCLPSQLWIHSSHTLWRQWSFGCTGYNAGMLLLFCIIESQNGIPVMGQRASSPTG